MVIIFSCPPEYLMRRTKVGARCRKATVTTEGLPQTFAKFCTLNEDIMWYGGAKAQTADQK